MTALSVKVLATDGKWQEVALCRENPLFALVLKKIFKERGITEEQIRIEKVSE